MDKKVRELNQRVEEKHGATYYELLKKFTTKTNFKERKHHKIIFHNLNAEVAVILYDMLKH